MQSLHACPTHTHPPFAIPHTLPCITMQPHAPPPLEPRPPPQNTSPPRATCISDSAQCVSLLLHTTATVLRSYDCVLEALVVAADAGSTLALEAVLRSPELSQFMTW